MNWQYADKYGELPGGIAEQVEAMVKIAEQLEQLNKTLASIERELSPLKISGLVSTRVA